MLVDQLEQMFGAELGSGSSAAAQEPVTTPEDEMVATVKMKLEAFMNPKGAKVTTNSLSLRSSQIQPGSV